MKKCLSIVLILLSSFSAFAAVKTFRCTLDKYPAQSFTFKMENLGQANMTFLNADADDDYSAVFTTRSGNDTVKQAVDTLNGQGGDLRIGADRISFFGDSAGVDFVYFDLFKNSGYRRGFMRMEFNFGEDKDYSNVTCTIR